jgi:hypothetical protein
MNEKVPEHGLDYPNRRGVRKRRGSVVGIVRVVMCCCEVPTATTAGPW